MSGQAPYVINAMLSYTLDSLGITTAIVYNVQGPRLAVVSPQPDVLPDVFEMPRHMIDFKVSKRIGKYFNVSISVKDILNAPVRRSYKLPDGYTVDFDNYRIGTNYNLSIGYKF